MDFCRLAVPVFLLGIFVSTPTFAYEFSNDECEFKVIFQKKPLIKTTSKHPSFGANSKLFSAIVEPDKRTGRVLLAQCDNSLRYKCLPTKKAKIHWIEKDTKDRAKAMGFSDLKTIWQEKPTLSLRASGRKLIKKMGKAVEFSLFTRTFLGDRSTMMVAGMEPTVLSPSPELKEFIDDSVPNEWITNYLKSYFFGKDKRDPECKRLSN
jgi:hypothetical protein